MDSANGGADHPFSIDKTGEVKLERPLDYETQMTYQLVIWVTDGMTVSPHLHPASPRQLKTFFKNHT